MMHLLVQREPINSMKNKHMFASENTMCSNDNERMQKINRIRVDVQCTASSGNRLLGASN